MLTHKEYMAFRGREEMCRLHNQYYGEIADVIGFVPPARLVELCRNGENKDGCWNETGLRVWDIAMVPVREAIDREMRKRGDFLSEAGAICVGKAAMRQFFERELAAEQVLDEAMALPAP